jgi:aminomethyltransferase
MPVEYSGIALEHQACGLALASSTSATWAKSIIAGSDALKAVQHITSNDASRLSIGQAHYSSLPTPQGTFVDDVLTYKLDGRALNAGRERSNNHEGLQLDYSQIAGIGDACGCEHELRIRAHGVSGPGRREVLQTLTGSTLGDIKYYWFTTGEVAGVG